jgi:hypothetical protein
MSIRPALSIMSEHLPEILSHNDTNALTSVTSKYMWPFNDDLMRFDFETDDDEFIPERASPFYPQYTIDSDFVGVFHNQEVVKSQ